MMRLCLASFDAQRKIKNPNDFMHWDFKDASVKQINLFQDKD